MDFFGFHPLYVVILAALALIIFGPSRLPKMGAQMGRMLREFQAARDGLTQQMREAFEEEPETDFATSTAPEEEEAEPASDGAAVAVLDPPPDGQTTPEALGTAQAPSPDTPPEEMSLGDQAAAGLTAALQTPAEDATDEEPEDAAALEAPAEPATAEEADTTAVSSSPAEDTTAEEPAGAAATLDGPAEPRPAVEPDRAETGSADRPGPAPEAAASDTEDGAETPAAGADAPFASAAGRHDTTDQTHDEESRAD